MSQQPIEWAGRALVGIGLVGLGLLSFKFGDFALQWQPVPAGLPARRVLAYLSGCLLLAGASLWSTRYKRRGAQLLCLYLGMFWVLPQMIHLATTSASLAAWLGLAETLGALAGLASMSWRSRGCQVIFGACCVIYGLSHFKYAQYTALMIPGWLPGRLLLAYLTGAFHLAAGRALITGQLTVLASRLEALMMAAFVVLLHVPSLWAAPPPAWAADFRLQATPLFWAMTLCGATCLLAASITVCASSAAGRTTIPP